MIKEIKNIVIVGGGTAGWTTALNFLQKTNDVKITVVSSKEIPIIGVGESTTGIMNNLININNGKVKINELSFIKETDSTFKLGIKHQDWYKKGDSTCAIQNKTTRRIVKTSILKPIK